MPHPSQTPLEIAIAGAGPVGMTLALGLAMDGHNVTVHEELDGLSTESRASTFHPSTLEELAAYGVVEDLEREGLRVPDYQYRDRREGLIARLDFSLIRGLTKFPYRIQVEQSYLTRVILGKLAAHPNATVRFGSKVTAARTVGARAEYTVVRAGAARTETADYVVAADGASSAVRKSLGIGFEGMTYPERYIVASTTFEFREVMPDISWVNYISDPDEWLLMLRTPHYWRIMFPLGPDEDDDRASSSAEIQRRLHGVHALDGDFPVLHTTVYRVHQRVADTYAAGRIALAGDAAHINNPLGGLGMNSGLFDAFALRAAFAEAAAGADGVALLAKYAEQQRDISVEYVGAQTDRNWKQLRESDPQRRRAQAMRMRDIVADPEAHRRFLLRSSMLERRLAA
ncbi:FAD-dependent oxidoreductase [Streptomyces odontomachi]|uniref:FAD-dependent oxidoreductase n=1 Tax=Streptomyces odontomachi TaxID=2944940 RepID=UPI00210B63F0|nr:NAD(P)/FAD-dependent oxidoreductase [Streptomyces sp. ODS25]